jgi:argininosuccinate lyase
MHTGQTITPDYDPSFYRSSDHFRHAAGEHMHEAWQYTLNGLPRDEQARIGNRLAYCRWTDRAWTVMLYRNGVIPKDTAQKILTAIKDDTDEDGFGGEYWLREKLGGDEDAAAAINIGRTLQEPMIRLQLRDKVNDLLDLILEIGEELLSQAGKHTRTLMQGQSHMSAAQPTTYAQYLIAVYDGLMRGRELLKVAYNHTNKSSAGCGACSGTGWPTDREMVAELLGFDGLVEPVYDCEASQDEMLSIMFALTHVAVLLSRVSMDMEIWSSHEHGTFKVPGAWSGVSSFMPQKAHTGTFEHLRTKAGHVVGNMISVVTTFKGEPLQDVLTVLACASNFTIPGACQAESDMRFFLLLLKNYIPDEERMMQNLLTEFSGSPDLQRRMVREKGYGLRRAHKIVATMVGLARDRQILPKELTGELLDEAARMCGEEKPGLETKKIVDDMTFVSFLENHCNTGDPCPAEGDRMIADRKQTLDALKSAQSARKEAIQSSKAALSKAIEEILAE